MLGERGVALRGSEHVKTLQKVSGSEQSGTLCFLELDQGAFFKQPVENNGSDHLGRKKEFVSHTYAK